MVRSNKGNFQSFGALNRLPPNGERSVNVNDVRAEFFYSADCLANRQGEAVAGINEGGYGRKTNNLKLRKSCLFFAPSLVL